MQRTIGRCSECGGNVAQYIGGWGGVGDGPRPQCVGCGAAKELPIIKMTPSSKKRQTFQDYVLDMLGPWLTDKEN